MKQIIIVRKTNVQRGLKMKDVAIVNTHHQNRLPVGIAAGFISVNSVRLAITRVFQLDQNAKRGASHLVNNMSY